MRRHVGAREVSVCLPRTFPGDGDQQLMTPGESKQNHSTMSAGRYAVSRAEILSRSEKMP